MDLSSYRKEIDEIDSELVRLFERRLDVATKVGQYKLERNLPIFNGAREEEVIERNIYKLANKDYDKLTGKFFENIMELSRELQNHLINSHKEEEYSDDFDCSDVPDCREDFVVGFFGVEGSFSEEAMISYFGEGRKYSFYEEFEEVFLAIKNNEIDYGVVPIENSSTGAITDVYDLLKKYGFYICGEQCLKIRQHLIGVEGTSLDNIKDIYSHPQGFEQSSEFLKTHSEWNTVPYHNTSRSVKMVCECNDTSKAAIGSKRAADIYGLKIIKEDINNQSENQTRFLVIGKNLEFSKVSNKVSIVFSLEDEAGTLYKLLRSFAENNINLMKIESRPIKNQPWKYLLYVDFEGNILTDEVKNALEIIESKSSYFKLLGNYKRSN